MVLVELSVQCVCVIACRTVTTKKALIMTFGTLFNLDTVDLKFEVHDNIDFWTAIAIVLTMSDRSAL